MKDISAVTSGAISADAVFASASGSIALGLIFGLLLAIAIAFFLFGGAKL